LSLLFSVVSRLPAPVAESSTTPTLLLILNRLSSLLTALSSTLSSIVSTRLAQVFYSTAVSIAFVKYEAGIQENEKDRDNWKLAIEFGLQAGVEELGKEVLRLQH
jgi:hypothetical protein